MVGWGIRDIYNCVYLIHRIADNSAKNLMKVSNLGVVFGPTLMRPEQETVASIVDIRYQNIIVECIIGHIDEASASP